MARESHTELKTKEGENNYMSSETTFQPIRLFLPDDATMRLLLDNASDPKKLIEVPFRLSSKPFQAWVNYFIKAWRIWHGDYNVPLTAAGLSTITVSCLPSQLREVRLLMVDIIDQANRLSAPRIRCEAARIAAAQQRNAKTYELELKHVSESVMITHDRDGEILANMRRQKVERDWNELKADLARSEIQTALDEMISDDLLDAMSRTEGHNASN